MAYFSFKLYILLFSIGFVASVDFDSSSSSEECDDDGRGHGGGGGHHGGGGGGNGNDGGNGSLVNGGCPTGWKRVDRPTGGWCMKVFPGPNWSYTVATATCNRNSAVLSGVQNLQERNWIVESAKATIGGGSGSIWVGARRASACIKKQQTAGCSQATSFYWTDASTTGSAGFTWLDRSQPDNAHGGRQNCIVMFYSTRNVSYKNVNWWPGAMDDVICDVTQLDRNGPRVIRGFVCGRSPRRN